MVQEVLDLFFEVHAWTEMTADWITFEQVYPDRFHYFRRYLDDLHFGNPLDWIQGSEIGLTHDTEVYDKLRALLTGPHIGVEDEKRELVVTAGRIVQSTKSSWQDPDTTGLVFEEEDTAEVSLDPRELEANMWLRQATEEEIRARADDMMLQCGVAQEEMTE
jgi:hypothetical protein